MAESWIEALLVHYTTAHSSKSAAPLKAAASEKLALRHVSVSPLVGVCSGKKSVDGPVFSCTSADNKIRVSRILRAYHLALCSEHFACYCLMCSWNICYFCMILLLRLLLCLKPVLLTVNLCLKPRVKTASSGRWKQRGKGKSGA